MKRITAIVILLAISLSCLTSCRNGTPISRSSVAEEWEALVGGAHKVVKMDISLWMNMSDFEVTNNRDSESIDKVITFLKEVETQIKNEIDDPFPGYSGIYNYYKGSIDLYMNTGAEDADVATAEDENGTYDYIVRIEFIHSECHVYISDGDRRLKTSAFFECEKSTSEHCKALKAIFE